VNSIEVPRLDSGTQLASDSGNRAQSYELIEFPIPTYRLLGGKDQLTDAEAQTYASWMSEEEPGRLSYIGDFFRSCGAPIADLPVSPEHLPELSRWLNRWFPIAFQPWKGEDSASHWWVGERGKPKGYWFPGHEGYSSRGNWFEVSVSHDLAFLIANSAREMIPGLRWQVSTLELTPSNPSDPRFHLPMLNAERWNVIPTLEAHSILRRSLAVPTEENAGRVAFQQMNALSSVLDRLTSGVPSTTA